MEIILHRAARRVGLALLWLLGSLLTSQAATARLVVRPWPASVARVLGGNISRAEYFVDADPGLGNGTAIALTPGLDVSGVTFTVNLSALTTGFHRLSTRTQDVGGVWSLTNTRSFYYQPATSTTALANITKAEYFIDAEPGRGNGTDIPVAAPGTDVSGLGFVVNLTPLTTGFHRLSTRSRDANGVWSLTNTRSFYYQTTTTTPTLATITKAEYFIDAEPGRGNGVDIPVATPGTDVSGLAFVVDLSTLTTGFHRLSTRTRDATSVWSLTNTRSFYYLPASAVPGPPAAITRVEYYLDTDPGFGSGTAVAVATPAPDLAGVGYAVDLNVLTNGAHRLFIRSRDADGKWSLVSNSAFTKSGCASAANYAMGLPAASYVGTNTSGTLSSAANVAVAFNTDPAALTTSNAPYYANTGTLQADLGTAQTISEVRVRLTAQGAANTTTITIQTAATTAGPFTTIDTYTTPLVANTPLLVARPLATAVSARVLRVQLQNTVTGNNVVVSGAGVFNFNCVTPSITTVAPASGPVGTSLTISGANLQGTSVLTFAGTSNNTVTTGFAVSADGTQITGIVVPGGAATGNLTATTPNGTSNGVSFTVTTVPSLLSIAPTSGPVGSTVALNGANLTGTTAIIFAGTASNTVTTGFAVNAAGTQITGIVVPTGAITGNVSATTPGGTTNGVAFAVTLPAPVLSSLTPTSGPVGTSVTISGTNLGGATSVSFNGAAQATIASNTTTSLVVAVPSGATTGNVTVTTPGGTSNGVAFTVTAAVPTISSFAPTFTKSGQTVTVTGTNLTGATGLTFSGVSQPTFTVNAAGTQLSAVVPYANLTTSPDLTSGTIAVTTPGGTGTSATALRLLAVTAATESAGATAYPGGLVGDNAAISGTGFGAATVTYVLNSVTYPVTFTVVGETQITATVPDLSGSTALNGSGSFIVTNTPGVSGANFEVLSPVIASISPGSGAAGTVVTVTGFNFQRTDPRSGTPVATAITGLTFGSVAGTSFQLLSPTQARATAPAGVATGYVRTSGSTLQEINSLGRLFTVTSGPLAIVSTSPAANVRAASATGPVAVTFNQAVTSGSTAALKVFSSQRGGLLSGASGSTTASGSTVSFAPTYAFRPGETVQAIVTTAATAASGGSLAAPRVVQFTAAAGAGPGTFSGGADPAVGGLPYSVTTADVDGDGDLDLLTANAASNTVSVRLNNGSGIFSGGSDPVVGSGPYTVTAADVDGDGDLDFLVTNDFAGTVSVRLNNGSGTFGGGSTVAVGSGAWGAATADVDGDGDLDLLTANHGTNTVSVRLNNGGGVFGGGSDPMVGNNPFCVATADVDGDGDLDLLAANETSNTVSVRLNNGSGVFSGSTELPVGSGPQSVTAADLDGDNDTDLLVANHGSNSVSVLLNNGSGAFSLASTVIVGAYAASVVAADIDGDGDLDLLVSNQNANTVSVRLNNGSAAFTGTATVNVGSAPIFMTTADVDGDGDLDLLTANQNGNTVSVRFNQMAAVPDLVVSTGTLASPVAVAAGTYNSITVTGTGIAQLGGSTVVNTSVSVSGTLLTNCQPLTGAASFALAAGAVLGICDPTGIAASGATGAVQTTGTRSFSPDASYLYNGTAAQATGGGLPAQVRNLSTTNANALTLTAPTSVARVLTVASAGNLVLNGQPLTLLSSASGTALVVNSGTGVVTGTATVQRYIDPSLNPGLGYRHYAAPVSNTTVADLATAGFSPEISQAAGYNASATPGRTAPFPTVFGYDQSRVTLANTYAPFDRGYVVPAAPGTALAVGRGYAVNLPGTALVDFVGSLTTGNQPLALSRVAGNAEAGWQLLGNPYPAPLDYSQVADGVDRTNLDAAIYVYSSTGQYAGQYRAYANGVGGNPVLPTAQGFFARVSAGQTTGSITFRNSQRLTAPEPTAFQRPTTDPRPLVQLDLRGATGPADVLYAYAQAGATPAFDSQFDAEKLPNPTGLNLSSPATSGERLAIDGRPAFNAATVLPLAVGVPAAGAYTLTAATLSNLPAGLDAYLSDAQTGQTVNLRTQPAYTFTVTSAQATALLTGRFVLRFAAAALAAAPALTAAQVTLYPNPAHDAFVVSLPAVSGATQVQAELLNALGQVLRHQTAALSAAGATLRFETTGLAEGVYLLRLSAGDARLTKRVVVQ